MMAAVPVTVSVVPSQVAALPGSTHEGKLAATALMTMFLALASAPAVPEPVATVKTAGLGSLVTVSSMEPPLSVKAAEDAASSGLAL